MPKCRLNNRRVVDRPYPIYSTSASRHRRAGSFSRAFSKCCIAGPRRQLPQLGHSVCRVDSLPQNTLLWSNKRCNFSDVLWVQGSLACKKLSSRPHQQRPDPHSFCRAHRVQRIMYRRLANQITWDQAYSVLLCVCRFSGVFVKLCRFCYPRTTLGT